MRSNGQATAGKVKRTDAAMAAGALFVCSDDKGNYLRMNFVLAGRSTSAVLARSQGAAAQWWMAAGVTPVAAYQAKGAASLAASYVNLANPGTYNAAPGVAPTWDAATGWISDGTKYLTTGIVPVDGATLIVRYSVSATVDSAIAGELVGSGSQWFGLRFLGQLSPKVIRFYSGGGVAYSSDASNGVLAISGSTGYLNGVAVAALAAVAGATGQIHIMRYYGVETRYMIGSIQSAWIGNTTLDAAAVAAQSAAMAAL